MPCEAERPTLRSMACPICKAPAAARYRPFCSRRCADVDLARWLNGGYAIPAEEEDAPDAADLAEAPPPEVPASRRR